MGERPRFEFPADPAKARYGPVAHGFKSFVDGLSRATGLGAPQVIAALLVAVGVSLALVVSAAVIIARDTGPAKPEPVTDYTPGGPPPPDHAALNPDGLGPSPAPTNILGESGPAYAAEEGAAPPTGASFDGSRGAQSIPLSSFLKFGGGGRPRQPAETAAAGEAPQNGDAGGRSWFKPKAWLLQKRDGPQAQEWFKGTQKSQQSSNAQTAQGGGPTQVPGGGAGIAPESMTKRRFAVSAEERAGRYANQLTGVPAIGEGVAVGAEDPPPGEAPVVKNPKGKVEGPVKQEKIPEVGPGKVVSAVQSGPGPSGQARIGAAAPSGDILSVPIDVNRIQVEANKSHDVDRSPGVNTIGN